MSQQTEVCLPELLGNFDEMNRVLRSAASQAAATWTSAHVERAFGWAEYVEYYTQGTDAEGASSIKAALSARTSSNTLSFEMLRGSRTLLL